MTAAILVAAALSGMAYYGGEALGRPLALGVKKVAVVSARAVSHPFRHPKQDAQAIKHAVVRPPNIHD